MVTSKFPALLEPVLSSGILNLCFLKDAPFSHLTPSSLRVGWDPAQLHQKLETLQASM
jgi:hypothetical protein